MPMRGELAYIVPITGAGLPGLPGSPEQPWVPGEPYPPEAMPPIVLPPLPPGMPDTGLPPVSGTPEYPIEIPSTPQHPINLPPGIIWPPLNPGEGVSGKALLLVLVPGAAKKFHWVMVQVPEIPMPK